MAIPALLDQAFEGVATRIARQLTYWHHFASGKIAPERLIPGKLLKRLRHFGNPVDLLTRPNAVNRTGRKQSFRF